MPLSVPSAYKYFQKNCPNFSRDRVSISRVGRRLKMVLLSKGKLKEVETYPEVWALALFVTKISEVCDGLPYDEREYYQPHTSFNAAGEEYDPKNPVHTSNPGQFSNNVNLGGVVWMRSSFGVDSIRKAHKYGQNIGLREVDKDKEALSVNDWIAKNCH